VLAERNGVFRVAPSASVAEPSGPLRDSRGRLRDRLPPPPRP
jgi:hypothetical protein